MKIRELEQSTGLDRATIRYYEQEGFITPQRAENGYRTYSVEHEETLLKIKLLRRLGMSLDHIRKLQQGSIEFGEAMDLRIRDLERKILLQQRARDICIEMQQNVSSYQVLDPRTYLELLDQPAAGSKPVQAFQESVPMEYHPFRRYIARIFDYHLLQAVLLFILVVLFRVRPIVTFVSILVSYGSYFLLLFINALFLSRFGTTPGKWLMGLSVESADGILLSFDEAFSRELDVL